MKQAAAILFTILLGTFVFLSHGCNIKLNVTSDTDNEFKLQVTVPSIEYESEPLTFEKQKDTKLLLVCFIHNISSV